MTEDLRRWTAIWHPAYRWKLSELLLMGTLLAAIAYAENWLLQSLIEALASPGTSRNAVVTWCAQLAGSGAPVLLLGLVSCVGLLRTLATARQDFVSSKLYIHSRDDLEQQILRNLLSREDSFYAQHSTAEIVGRLDVDLPRVLERRESVVGLWTGLLTLASNLVFFSVADVRLSVVVLLICAIGAVVTLRASNPVQAADQKYFESRDRVKLDLEDYLKAVPEVQVGRLDEVIVRRFRKPQSTRFRAFMQWLQVYLRVDALRSVSAIVALLATVLIVILAKTDATSADASRMALIPVLIYALPRIFNSVTSLVNLRTTYQMSTNSVDRLAEYEATPAERGRWSGSERAVVEQPPSAIEVEGATFQYRTPGGSPQGGVVEVTTRFERGKWAALVGGAGSGKSTLSNLILGRTDLQRGVIQGVTGTASTLMPQKVVLLDTSIRTNLLLGSREDPDAGALSDADLELIEETGLGGVCRLKALEMRPTGSGDPLDPVLLRQLRDDVRARARQLSIPLAPFEDGRVDPRRPVVDALLGGRTDAQPVVKALLGGGRPAWLERLAASPLAEALAPRARHVLEQNRNLLQIPEYGDFSNLAPEPVEQPVWELRRAALHALEGAESDKVQVVRVALTCVPAEWGADQAAADQLFTGLRERHPQDLAGLRDVLAPHWRPYGVDDVHPFLTWRDNLLFASADVVNQRQKRLLDQSLLELMREPRCARFFLSQGVEFEIGRNGSRLSGGQGQLVALTRAALRRTPVLVLDEPTSALDPSSRERVGDFLGRFSADRIVIVISHDPELVRRSDDIHVMSAGRHVGAGSHDQLLETCEAYRTIFGRAPR